MIPLPCHCEDAEANSRGLPMPQVPLDETIIWVELTLFQKKCYK